MASLNQCSFIGNLGADPEVRSLGNGGKVVNLRLACSETWKDKATGEKKEQTEWHRITFFGKLAEIAGKYLVKGSQVYIEGSLRTRKYTDKDGVEKYATDIKADTMQMLGSKQQSAEQPASRQQPAQSKQEPAGGGFDDDIPFAPISRKAWAL